MVDPRTAPRDTLFALAPLVVGVAVVFGPFAAVGAALAGGLAALNLMLMHRLTTRFLRESADPEAVPMAGVFLPVKMVLFLGACAGLVLTFGPYPVLVALLSPILGLCFGAFWRLLRAPVDDLSDLKKPQVTPGLPGVATE